MPISENLWMIYWRRRYHSLGPPTNTTLSKDLKQLSFPNLCSQSPITLNPSLSKPMLPSLRQEWFSSKKIQMEKNTLLVTSQTLSIQQNATTKSTTGNYSRSYEHLENGKVTSKAPPSLRSFGQTTQTWSIIGHHRDSHNDRQDGSSS